MPSLGGWELVIILAVLLLLFGAKKLPDMARSVGQSARVFKGEMKGLKDDEAGSGGRDGGASTDAATPAEPPRELPRGTAPSPSEQAQAQPSQENVTGGPAQQGRADAT